MRESIMFETNGAVATITLNYRGDSNGVTRDAIAALAKKCAEVNGNLNIRCVIVTGTGAIFCNDDGNVEGRNGAGGLCWMSGLACRDGYADDIRRISAAVDGLEVPTIAAINGYAVGAGCELALRCDIRIASEKAFFAESLSRPEVALGGAGAWLLPRVIGLPKTYEMAFTGTLVDARTALQWGLVSRVVQEHLLLHAANELAGKIAMHTPHALRLTKRLLRDSEGGSLVQSLSLAASLEVPPVHPHGEVSVLSKKRDPAYKDN